METEKNVGLIGDSGILTLRGTISQNDRWFFIALRQGAINCLTVTLGTWGGETIKP